MSHTRTSCDDMHESNIKHDDMVVDEVLRADNNDDEELILVFPPRSFGSIGTNARVERRIILDPAMTNVTNSPPIRPRHVSSRICHTLSQNQSTTTNTQFRLSPCYTSPSIWSIIHQPPGFGTNNSTTSTTTSRSYRTPPTSSQATNDGYHLLYRPPTSSTSSIHNDDHNINYYNILPSPGRNVTPTTTTTIPCLPIIESPVENIETISYHSTRNDMRYDLQRDTIDENNQCHHRHHRHQVADASSTQTISSSTATTTIAPTMTQLPVTTATVAASLRMRKHQQQPYPRLPTATTTMDTSVSCTTTRIMNFHPW